MQQAQRGLQHQNEGADGVRVESFGQLSGLFRGCGGGRKGRGFEGQMMETVEEGEVGAGKRTWRRRMVMETIGEGDAGNGMVRVWRWLVTRGKRRDSK